MPEKSFTEGVGSPLPGPVDPRQRLVHVDMIRGFALFGVLLVNMFNFGAWSIIWTDPHDVIAGAVTRFFFETKSWRLFSFLFGFGFALQFLRVDKRLGQFLPRYIWRLTLLFGFGVANALLYDGDILMYYAEMGLLLILFLRVPSRYLLLIIAGLLLVFPVQRAVHTTLSGLSAPLAPFATRLEEAQARNAERLATHPYAIGSVAEVMTENAQDIPPNILADLYGVESSFAFFAMFLLGLYVGRRRILHEPENHQALIRRTFRWGIGLGLLAMSIERLLAYGIDYRLFGGHRIALLPQFVGDFTFAFGATALALGYAASVLLLSQHERWRRAVVPLAAIGRMALSIYLLQTLMFSTLFYGYGFGQAGRIGPGAVLGYAVVFFAMQIVIANWWLRRFRFGPVEWLWRSLTYWKPQPMRLD